MSELVSCSDCVWADECEDAKEDGWCEDFCLKVGNITTDKIWDISKKEGLI